MSELRECPGCGQPGKIRCSLPYEAGHAFLVVCTDRECGWMCGNYPTEAEAIAAWNQRATPSPSAQLTAALGECALLTEACKELESELAAIENSLALACEREAALRADRDEAIGAALRVEQKNYDQAQEIKVLHADISTLEVRLMQMMDISADRGRTLVAYERELLPLRKLREACEALADDDGVSWLWHEQGPKMAGKAQALWEAWYQALAACDEACTPGTPGKPVEVER